jgi:hypothetical protein
MKITRRDFIKNSAVAPIVASGTAGYLLQTLVNADGGESSSSSSCAWVDTVIGDYTIYSRQYAVNNANWWTNQQTVMGWWVADVENGTTPLLTFEQNLASVGWTCIPAAPNTTLPFTQPSCNGQRVLIPSPPAPVIIGTIYYGAPSAPNPPFTVQVSIRIVSQTHYPVDCSGNPIQ